MIPLVILYMTLSKKMFALFYVVGLLIVYGLTGSAGPYLVILSVFFTVPVVVMGQLYRKKSSARSALTGGVVAFLAEMLIGFMLSYLMGTNVVEVMGTFIRESFATLPKTIQSDISSDVIDSLIGMLTQMIPFYMIAISLFYVAVTHTISRRILKATGHPLPGLGPIKQWMLPKSFVIYYVIALVLDMILPTKQGSGMTMILLNLIPLLMFAFSVQAIGFLFFLTDVKKWNRAIPFVGIIALFFLPTVVSLVGLFDVAFPIRKTFQK